MPSERYKLPRQQRELLILSELNTHRDRAVLGALLSLLVRHTRLNQTPSPKRFAVYQHTVFPAQLKTTIHSRYSAFPWLKSRVCTDERLGNEDL